MKKIMKWSLGLFICAFFSGKAAAAESVPINNAYFPDEYFRTQIVSQYDLDQDGILSEEEQYAVSDILINYSMDNLSQTLENVDLTGIEYFSDVRTLSIRYCNFDRLFIPNLPKLKSIHLASVTVREEFRMNVSGIRSVDIANSSLPLEFKDLKELQVLSLNYMGNLTALSVENCPKLSSLEIINCPLSSLSLDGTTNIANLTLFSTQLSEVNLAAQTGLVSLECSYNPITVLDISSCKKLEKLECITNQSLHTLDVSHNQKLSYLCCSYNSLDKLDVSSLKNLKELYCTGNALSKLDVSKNKKLSILWCKDNDIEKLDVSKNKKLGTLCCSKNRIHRLDLRHNRKLIWLDSCNNNIKWLYLPDTGFLHGGCCGESIYSTAYDSTIGEKSKIRLIDISSVKSFKGNGINKSDVWMLLSGQTHLRGETWVVYGKKKLQARPKKIIVSKSLNRKEQEWVKKVAKKCNVKIAIK